MCYRNKEVTEAGKLAYISFFEIRPIIFSLREDAKLGKPVRSKQKMRERCTIKVLWARALERAHENTEQFTSCPFQLAALTGLQLVSAPVMGWEASLWPRVEETRGQQRLHQGDWSNTDKRGRWLASKSPDPIQWFSDFESSRSFLS